MNHDSLAQKYARKCILVGVKYSLKIVIILIFQVSSHSSNSFVDVFTLQLSDIKLKINVYWIAQSWLIFPKCFHSKNALHYIPL